MPPFEKRSSLPTNVNLTSLQKNKSRAKLIEEKINEGREQKQLQQRSSVGFVSRAKSRMFSLSKLDSVQQSQVCQQINSIRKYDDPLVRSLTDKVVFQKLNFHSVQGQRQAVRSSRQGNGKNPLIQTTVQQQFSLLKMILKKKEDDLLVTREKQQRKVRAVDEQKVENNNIQTLSSSNSIKRIKLLKKHKEYQYYDKLVHNLLFNLKHHQMDNVSVNQQKQTDQKQITQNSQPTSNDQTPQRKLRSTSLASIRRIQKDKLISTCDTNFSSTNNLLNTIKTPLSLALTKKRQAMVFNISNATSDSVYEKKINTFIEFLFKVNFSNSIYVDLSLKSLGGGGSKGYMNGGKKTYKIFIGRGNNSELVKSVIKRRFWLQATTNKQQANLVWTQDTQKDIHLKQLQTNISSSGELSNNQGEQILLNKKPTFSLKHKFTKPTYNQQSNAKILHTSEIQQADACYSRSYMGLKSPHPQVTPKLITNHIPNNSIIGSKKILFKLMHWYYSEILNIDPFTYLPHTYHIIPGEKENQGIKKFNAQQLQNKQRIWIVKPGENTNRGNGISVATTNQIQRLMRYKKFHKNGQPKTYIVQKYLKPFLYNSRKFDIRHYLLITSVNGIIKAYWYKSGYIRTSSQKFDMDQLDNQFIHLTNDAIQKNSENYGKYQEGNKLSYSTFQRYLDNTVPHKKYDFEKQIVEEMRRITTDVMRAGFLFLDPERSQRLQKGNGCNFQLYGMDFMIDHKFKPYLIEINANPCLEISCPLLQRLIPIALQHTFRLSVDPLLPPPQHYSPSKRYQLSDKILERMKFQLIFDEKHQGEKIREKCSECENKFEITEELEPDEDLFEDDGVEIKDQAVFDEVRE